MKNTDRQSIHLDKKDVNSTFYRWWWSAEISNSFERMQGLAFGASFGKVLKKLYGNDKNMLTEALHRQLTFFNTEPMWGSIILGSTLAMEEKKAQGEKLPAETITSFKTGLMGPMASIGDTINAGTIQTIVYTIAISLANEGSVVGAFLIVLYSIFVLFLGRFLMNLGYREGQKSIVDLLESGKINQVIQTASILGMFMMGALSATMIRVTTPVSFNIAGADFVLQDTFDMIIPGILPLITVLLIYYGLKYKKISITKMMLILTVVCLLGSLIGIL